MRHGEYRETLAVKEFLDAYISLLDESVADQPFTLTTGLEHESVDAELHRETIETELTKITPAIQSYASDIELHDWARRLPAASKRVLTMSALGFKAHAYAITFRLSHKVAQTALAAKRPTEHIAAILKRLGLRDFVFVFEYSDSESEENHPLHIHGIAIIPDELLIELTREQVNTDGELQQSKLRAALAPDYRERWGNKAIDIQPIQTPVRWVRYMIQEITQTSSRLDASPDYATQSASRIGQELYAEIRRLAGNR